MGDLPEERSSHFVQRLESKVLRARLMAEAVRGRRRAKGHPLAIFQGPRPAHPPCAEALRWRKVEVEQVGRCLAQAVEQEDQGPVVWWLNLPRKCPPPKGAGGDGAHQVAGRRMNPGPAPRLAPETHLQLTNCMT